MPTVTIALPLDALDGITVVASPPAMVTQRNVEAVVGVPPEAFLALLRSRTFPGRVAKVGKLRVVDRAEFVTWLQEGGPPATEAEEEPPDEPEVQEEKAKVANVAAELGFARSPAPASTRRRR